MIVRVQSVSTHVRQSVRGIFNQRDGVEDCIDVLSADIRYRRRLRDGVVIFVIVSFLFRLIIIVFVMIDFRPLW